MTSRHQEVCDGCSICCRRNGRSGWRTAWYAQTPLRRSSIQLLEAAGYLCTRAAILCRKARVGSTQRLLHDTSCCMGQLLRMAVNELKENSNQVIRSGFLGHTRLDQSPLQGPIHGRLPEYTCNTDQLHGLHHQWLCILCTSPAIPLRLDDCQLRVNSKCKVATAETAVILGLNVALSRLLPDCHRLPCAS